MPSCYERSWETGASFQPLNSFCMLDTPVVTDGVGMHQCIVEAMKVKAYEQCMICRCQYLYVSIGRNLCAK